MIPVVRRHLWWVSGLVLVVVGVVLVLATRTAPESVSWLSYAPVSEGPDWEMAWPEPAAVAFVVTPWQVVGVALATVGLLIVAAGLGFVLGRRPTDRPAG